MVSPFHGRRMSPAEYLALERASDVKHELVDGVVRAAEFVEQGATVYRKA